MSTPGTGGAQPPQDPRATFAELSKIMLGEQPLSATLARVAELAKRTIPGAAEVSVTLMHDGDVESAAFTGPLAAQLDERQYEAGFGPCMDAAVSGVTIPIDDTADSAAYPDFGRAARHHGITHSLSVGLPVPRQVIGALNVYGTDGGTFDEQTRELATTFASYAAVAVANAGLYSSTAQLAAQLQRALESRAVIDQAKGILMSRHGLSADAAFDLLAKQSQTAQRKLRDIAHDLVEEVQRGRDG
ncbi:GAF domain-containing protein [Geodermatophilus bullaregiensis]|uniref:GAF and ANTAR domain-containing protein n=1 Tax=Geodermatophilus bullaregiensis TaxID=1564160 RepID=UPI00195DCA37|nr:GAF and ANTAR domain-containing protein [Geodermatophilus bullaregiensis]MBM7806201.1 GAF domain-containing protein [Geodermatophilus bullaregiensis]